MTNILKIIKGIRIYKPYSKRSFTLSNKKEGWLTRAYVSNGKVLWDFYSEITLPNEILEFILKNS